MMDEAYANVDFGGGVYHNYEITSLGDGTYGVRAETNDDEDRGYPSSYAEWGYGLGDAGDDKRFRFDSLEAALKHTGKSRTGFTGCKVTVRVDGEKV